MGILGFTREQQADEGVPVEGVATPVALIVERCGSCNRSARDLSMLYRGVVNNFCAHPFKPVP